MSNAPKDPIATFRFSLDVQGVTAATFHEAAGFENSTDVIEHRQIGQGGKVTIMKLPGGSKWADITLKRGFTDSMDLYDWRQKVLDGDMDAARKDGSITGYDAKDNPVIQYTFTRGWISKWKGATFSAKDNNVAVEEITITHEGVKRVK